MGYILVLVLTVALVVVLMMAFMGGKKRATGRTRSGNDVTFKQPASENQATPHASEIASDRAADEAQKRTPPG